jgi:hypothetical protein
VLKDGVADGDGTTTTRGTKVAKREPAALEREPANSDREPRSSGTSGPPLAPVEATRSSAALREVPVADDEEPSAGKVVEEALDET